MTDRFRWLEFDGPGDGPRKPEEPLSAHRAAQERHLKASSRALLDEAREAWREGDWEPALRRYSRALERDPSLAEAWAGQVRCLFRLGRFEDARVWADKAAERFPDDGPVHAVRALVLARLGMLQEASESAWRATRDCLATERAGPRSPLEDGQSPLLEGVPADLGRYHFLIGQVAEASGCVERLLSERAYLEAALLLMDMGQPSAAREAVDAALAASGDSPFLWLLAARLAHASGDVRRARGCLDRALALRRPYAAAEDLRRSLGQEGILGSWFGWPGR